MGGRWRVKGWRVWGEIQQPLQVIWMQHGKIWHEREGGYFSLPTLPNAWLSSSLAASFCEQKASMLRWFTRGFSLLVYRYPLSAPRLVPSFHAAPTQFSATREKEGGADIWTSERAENYRHTWELVGRAWVSEVQRRALRNRGWRNTGWRAALGDLAQGRGQAAPLEGL